jgi:hypothetical protein
MATDYSAEISALKSAIATGATQVRYQDYSVTYDSLDKMLARLRWLEAQQPGAAARPRSGVASFSRGDC